MTREEAKKLLKEAEEAHANGYKGVAPEVARGYHLIIQLGSVEAVQSLDEVDDTPTVDVMRWLDHGGPLVVRCQMVDAQGNSTCERPATWKTMKGRANPPFFACDAHRAWNTWFTQESFEPYAQPV